MAGGHAPSWCPSRHRTAALRAAQQQACQWEAFGLMLRVESRQVGLRSPRRGDAAGLGLQGDGSGRKAAYTLTCHPRWPHAWGGTSPYLYPALYPAAMNPPPHPTPSHPTAPHPIPHHTTPQSAHPTAYPPPLPPPHSHTPPPTCLPACSSSAHGAAAAGRCCLTSSNWLSRTPLSIGS